jgi:hypothetical protein
MTSALVSEKEVITSIPEFLLNFVMIRDHTVVYDGETTVAAEVRISVFRRQNPMGCPLDIRNA